MWSLPLVNGVNNVARNWDLSIIKSKLMKVSTSLVLCCLSSQVFASGFQLLEQSVSLLGTAFSGTAALAEDASTGYYNPAGLTRIVDSQVVLGNIVIQGDFYLEASAATSSLGNPLGSGDSHPGRVVSVPNFHLAKRIDDRWVFGVNVTTPFGLSTKYGEDSIARYLATNSEIFTIDLSPSMAYQILPCLSLGFGVDAQYAQATLSVRVGAGNPALDGYQRNHANGWGYGYHFGILWEPFESTRVGLNYRSLINLHTDGNSENLIAQPIGYVLAKVRSDITLPETATLSIYQELLPCLALTGDIAWTNWSRFHTLRLRYNRPLNIPNPLNPSIPVIAPDTDTWEHFKDTRRVALGLIYLPQERWILRAGLAFDESPVRNDFRTARLPDSNRYWLALGGAYCVNEALRVDLGYAHIFFKDRGIDEHAPFIAQTETPVSLATMQGQYKSSANLVGIQICYDFV